MADGEYNSKYDLGMNARWKGVNTAKIRQTSRARAKELYPNDIEAQKGYIHMMHEHGTTQKEFQGYSTCPCSNPTYRPGIVLDPFAGSGTTLAVAERLSRKWIGIEINPEYISMAYKRIREFEIPLFGEIQT